MFIIIAVGAYFLGALAIILDKFLLGSKRISTPPVYAFYLGLFGLFASFALLFVHFSFPSSFQITVSFLSGILFTYGILALYFAIKKSEASRVVPVVGAVIPIVTFVASWFLLGEGLMREQLFGVLLLVSGGLLISFDLPLRKEGRKFFAGFRAAILAGILLAVATTLFKSVYEAQEFFSGFALTRIGAFFGALSFLLYPKWRREIFQSFKNVSSQSQRKKNFSTAVIFVGNKILGGFSSLGTNWAIALGSVTLVNALVPVQYVFVLFLAMLSAHFWPKIYAEKFSFNDWIQKVVAIALIALGIVLISLRLQATLYM